MKLHLNKKSLPVIAVLLLIIIVIGIFMITGKTNENGKRKHISFIVYGDDNERWENMRQGAGLVCGENDADITLVTMLTEDDVNEQIEIIEREISNGADALIIAACDSGAIREYINSRKARIPVVFVEASQSTGLALNDVPDFCPDDYRMGYELGETLVENESDIVTVAVISGNTKRDSVAMREKGLKDAITGKVGKELSWTGSRFGKSTQTRVFIQRALVSEATDVIVTLDNTTTDALLDAMENLNQSSKVYAISTSNKAVYYLNGTTIKALGFPDEFSMGYLAAMYVLDRSKARNTYAGKEIEYRIVRKEDMYDADNQTLLFPFVN
ncbi:MAG: substrate-binding domain-containing protein [Lachnospiraceae bacterium]|nr:substrate-binding domain-containing protein [Lachnospiraceae bacterium]